MDRIKISREFGDNIIGHVWIGLERDVPDGANDMEQYWKAYVELVNAHQTINQRLSEAMVVKYNEWDAGSTNGLGEYSPPLQHNQEIKIKDYRANERMEKLIDDCKTLEELGELKKDLNADTIPMWVNKFKELENNFK